MQSQWLRLKEIFLEVSELEPAERGAYLDSACGSDSELRAEIERLLSHSEESGLTLPEPETEVEQWVFAPGDRIADRFEIVHRLGFGGMGQVYEAQDRKLGKRVALKTLKLELLHDRKRCEDFKREIRQGQDISHQNICRIHDLVPDDPHQPERLSFTMELLEGGTLADFLKRKNRPLTAAEALPLIKQMAAGLAELHGHGIVHRDFKPGNVMLAKTIQGGPLVKITDFGLARPSLPQGRAQTWPSGVGGIEGTPGYMAPEQFSTKGGEIGPASDVYALGTVIYEMVTRRAPYEAYDLFELAVLKKEQPPIPPRRHAPDLDKRWEETILRCLERKPDDRPRDVLSVARALEDRAETKQDSGRNRSHGWLPATFAVNDKWGIAAAIFIFIAVALLALAFRDWKTEGPRSPAAEQRLHVAVLPITATGGDAELQSLADGLMATITMRLSQYEGWNRELLVASPSEVRRQEVASPADALKKLAVNYVVEGDLQSQGDRLRLTLSLVDSQKMWLHGTATVEGTRANAFSLQDGALTQLANLLNLRIQPDLLDSSASPAVPRAAQFYYRGLGYLQESHKTENLESAIAMFERALENDGEYALAHAGLGEAYWQLFVRTSDPGFVEKAVESCQRALESNDQLVEVHVTLGHTNAGTGNYEEAVADFTAALKLDARNADAFAGLASVYAQMERPDEAVATYHKAIALRPGDWRMHRQLGAFHFNAREYEKAVESFRQVVDLTPNSPQGYLNLGAALHAWGRREELSSLLDQAEAMYRRSVEIEPRPAAVANLAKFLYDRGQYAEAAKEYERATLMKENDYLVWGNLAAAYDGIQDHRVSETYRRAAELAQQALEVNPERSEIYGRLAYYYAGAEEPKQADYWLAKSASHEAIDALETARNAATSEKLGRREEALRWTQQAMKQGATHADLEKFRWLQPLLEDERYRRTRGE